MPRFAFISGGHGRAHGAVHAAQAWLHAPMRVRFALPDTVRAAQAWLQAPATAKCATTLLQHLVRPSAHCSARQCVCFSRCVAVHDYKFPGGWHAQDFLL